MSVSEKIDQLVSEVKLLLEQHDLPYYQVLKYEAFDSQPPRVKIGIILEDDTSLEIYHSMKLLSQIRNLKKHSDLPDKLRNTPYLSFHTFTKAEWDTLVDMDEIFNSLKAKLKEYGVHFSHTKMRIKGVQPLFHIQLLSDEDIKKVLEPTFYTELWMIAKRAKLSPDQYQKLEITFEKENYQVYKEPHPFIPPSEIVILYPHKEEVKLNGQIIN